MPVIREYQPQTNLRGGVPGDVPGRRAQESDVGGPGLAQLGGSLISAAGDVARAGRSLEDQAAQSEVTDAHVNLARLHARFTLDLKERETTAQPGDETFSSKYLEDVNKQLEEVGDRYQTRNGKATWARGAATLGSHFVEQAGLSQAKLAGVKAVQDYTALVDSNQIILNNDPMQFDGVMKATTEALLDPNGSYSRIPAEQRDKVLRVTREQLAASAMQGIIRMDPEYGQKILQAGTGPAQFVTGEAKNQLEKTAEVGIRMNETEKARLEKALQKAQEEVNHKEADRLFSLFNDDKLAMKDVMQSPLPAFGDESKDHFRRLIETELKERPLKSSSAAALELFARIHLPHGDPRKITNETQINNEYIKHRITRDDLNALRKEVGDARTVEGEKLGVKKKDFFEGMAPHIDKSNPLMGKIDESGKDQLYQFKFFVDQKVEEFKQAKKDPFVLFDPSSPEYLGKPQILSGFQKTMQQSMKDFSDKLRRQPGITGSSGVPDELKRKEGETIQQYLDRKK